MNIPELHLPTENKEFIKNPYEKMGEFRESTPVFWDEINVMIFSSLLDIKMFEASNQQNHLAQRLII